MLHPRAIRRDQRMEAATARTRGAVSPAWGQLRGGGVVCCGTTEARATSTGKMEENKGTLPKTVALGAIGIATQTLIVQTIGAW